MIVYCISYRKPPLYPNEETFSNDCVDDCVFRSKSSIDDYLEKRRKQIERNHQIACLVHHDIQKFEKEEYVSLMNDTRLPDYPARIYLFREKKWKLYNEELPDEVQLTSVSDIFIIREITLIE